MKKIKSLILVCIIFILTSCAKNRPADVTEFLKAPQSQNPNITGTRKVTKELDNEDVPSTIKKGDLLYIDKDLVAIGDSYALPPEYTSKFVNFNDYLSYKGLDYSVSNDKKYVEILTVSQAQLFSKDFLVLSSDKLMFFQNNSIYLAVKIKDEVDPKIIDHYKKKSMKERTNTDSGDKTTTESSVLVGVRERVDKGENDAEYNYKTYMLRINSKGKVYSKACDGIVFPKNNSFRMATSNMNLFTGQYDNIRSYPYDAVIKDREDDPHKFQNSQLDLRIDFVNSEYISFDYTVPQSEYNNVKYGVIETNNTSGNSMMKISDFTGEGNSEEIFRAIIFNEVKNSFDGIDSKDLKYDYSNFGISHSQGSRIFQSSYQVNTPNGTQSKTFPLDIAFEDKKLNENTKLVSMDQIRNISSQAKDFYQLKDQDYLILNKPDEISVYRLKSGIIEETPIYSIPLENPVQFIMLDEAEGEQGLEWEKFFIQNETYKPFLEK